MTEKQAAEDHAFEHSTKSFDDYYRGFLAGVEWLKDNYECLTGREIKERIKEMGITQQEFARMVGVADITLYRYFTRLGNLSESTIEKMAIALGIPKERLPNK